MHDLTTALAATTVLADAPILMSIAKPILLVATYVISRSINVESHAVTGPHTKRVPAERVAVTPRRAL